MRDARAAHELANKLGIPFYDAAVVGYPQRMRDWNARSRDSGAGRVSAAYAAGRAADDCPPAAVGAAERGQFREAGGSRAVGRPVGGHSAGPAVAA